MSQALKKIEFTEQQIDKAMVVLGEFELYCRTHLVIQGFTGAKIPFILNAPQRRFIKTILQQWEDIGMIRVVIAKARKMGFSTVITAFIFWRLTTNINIGAIAGTHHDSTNSVLVDIFKLFYDNIPKELQPTVGDDNAGGMSFKNINTEYSVQAASNAEKVGRGPTVQMIHVSEIAHIDNAGALPKSLFSAVGGNVENSMIFLESTANGMGNYHHTLYERASDKKKHPGCKFIAFFAAWYEDERYTEKVSESFVMTIEEEIEKSRYNLTSEQVAWRRSMIETMDGTEKQQLAQFRQEYPANEVEAFQYSAVDSFLEAADVLAAMARPLYDLSQSNYAITAGYDPTLKGVDRDAFMLRQGPNMFGLQTPKFGDSQPARIAFCKRELDKPFPYIHMMFIDVGGGGAGIYSHLCADGYDDRVTLVDFGSSSTNELKYKLKRDEMFGEFRDLLINKELPLAIEVDDETAFLVDATATGFEYDDRGRPKMESKKLIKKRLKISTDLIDAAILNTAKKIIVSYTQSIERTESSDDSGCWFEKK